MHCNCQIAPVNILIVDECDESSIALNLFADRQDIFIYSTTCANEGIKLALENHVGIVLINVQRQDMDTFKFVETLKSHPDTKDIFFIFILAEGANANSQLKGLNSGIADVLFMPGDPLIASAKINTFIQLAKYRAEIQLKNQEIQNLSLIVKNSGDVVCTVDAQTLTIRSVNPAIEQLLGFKPEDLVGTDITGIANDTQKAAFRLRLADMVTHNTVSSVFDMLFNAAGKTTVATQCRAGYQNNAILLTISIEIKKDLQAPLIKSKETVAYSDKAKETFLANMSHELRTPVNGIIGLTALLRKTALDEQQNSMIDLMEVSSQSLLGVINDVLDISKMDAGKFTIHRSPNNLHDLLRSVYGLLKFKADEGNIEFLLEISPEVPTYIMVDSLRLNQILMNLLSNAIKFTRCGFVKLDVAAGKTDGNQVDLIFTVQDSGIGIHPAKLSTIFESFEQAEEDTATIYGGTGLGLAIVKKLAELKQGQITVSSQLGQGSIFTYKSTYTITAKPKEKRSSGYAAMEQFDNVSILVAEDNLVNQFLLAKMLKDWNIEVDMVDNGMKVIDKLHQNRYDLILMDTHMPELNGYDAAKAIRTDFTEPIRSIPIISLSAASFEYEQQEAVLAGMNDVLSKPFKPAELHEKMKRLLKEVPMIKTTIDA